MIKTPQVNNSSIFDNCIWTIEQVAAFLECSVGTIYNKVSKGKIPFKKRGKLYFIPKEILDWLNEGVQS